MPKEDNHFRLDLDDRGAAQRTLGRALQWIYLKPVLRILASFLLSAIMLGSLLGGPLIILMSNV
jgi:hypothetical protein